MFSKPHLLSEPMIAQVEPMTCVDCLTCQSVCAYSAIEEVAFKDPLTRQERMVAKVNEGLCNGCGTCVAACNSSSIQLRGFTDEQVFREIESALAS
jgi:heterodisulfide reductase subunit A